MRSTIGTRTRRILASAAAILVAVSLAGCGSVDAGTAGRQATEREFRSDPAVESVDLTSLNTLPWIGSVDGTVTAKPGLSDDDLSALVDRIGAFESEKRGGASVSLKVAADTVTLRVLPDRARNARFVAAANELRADTGIVSAELEVRSGDGSKLTARTSTAERAFALAAETPGPLRERASETPVELDVSSVDGVSLEGDQGGTWIADAQRVWATVGLRARVTLLEATPEALDLQVAEEADVAAARAAAEAALGHRPMALTVESRSLQLRDGASGDTTRATLAKLPAETRKVIDFVWTDDAVLQLHLKPGTALAPVATALLAVPEASGFRTLALMIDGRDLGSGGSGAPIGVFAEPGDLVPRATGVDRLLATGTVAGTDTARKRIDVMFRANAGPKERAALAPVLKSFAQPADWVCVKGGEPAVRTLCVTAAERISMSDVEEAYRSQAEDFLARWNAAPSLGTALAAE